MGNKLIIAGAGSWKTSFIVDSALEIKESLLITTFTEANEEEIKKKIIEKNKYIPKNITIQTWFSFLLQHWIKPYQWWIFDKSVNWLILVEWQSAVKFVNKKWIKICFKEEETEKHYFSNDSKIFSDKLSKFVIKADKCNNWEVINRITSLFNHIFIDEVQDLAGYDLELIKLLFDSKSDILLVWDPRQVTYLTHHESKYWKYKDGKIAEFINSECKKGICEIDTTSFNHSYRNNNHICSFSAKLYPWFPACISKQSITSWHDWIFLIPSCYVEDYIKKYNPQVLKYEKSEFPELNYGISKWLWFNRVLIYPTEKIKKYLLDWNLDNIKSIIPKFYVAITRAVFSVWIVYDYKDWEKFIDWVEKWDINM